MIQNGLNTNVVDNHGLLNQYNQGLINGTQINLTDALYNKELQKVDATTNISNKTDIYLDGQTQNKSIELITHENAHQGWFDENSAISLGELGEAAFNVNSWVNANNIETAKTDIQATSKPVIAGVNDAQAQQDLLRQNQAKLSVQQVLDDSFEDRQPSFKRGNSIDERLGKDVNTHSSVVFKSDKSVMVSSKTIANDLRIAGKCSTESQCMTIAANLNQSDKTYFISSSKDNLRVQAEVLMSQLGDDFRQYARQNPQVLNQVTQTLLSGSKQAAVDISHLYNIAEGLAYLRMYKDSGVIPPKGIWSAVKDSHNISIAKKLDTAINQHSQSYPQDIAIDDLGVKGKQIETGLTIASTALSVADLAYIGKNGLTAFKAIKVAEAAEKSELAAAKVSNNLNRDNDLLSDNLDRAIFGWGKNEISNPSLLKARMNQQKVEINADTTYDKIFNEVMQKDIGARPLPETYLSKDYISKQLSKFDDDASRFMLEDAYNSRGIGHMDGTSFVLAKSEVDSLMRQTGGNSEKIADFLGIPREQLKNGTLVRIDINNPQKAGLRLPSGNEKGANPYWIPGSKLPSGFTEGVIDANKVDKSMIKITKLK